MDGSQRHLTAGTDRARRYLKGFSPIVAFADPEAPAFEDLASICEPGERFYCSEWSGSVPDGWACTTSAWNRDASNTAAVRHRHDTDHATRTRRAKPIITRAPPRSVSFCSGRGNGEQSRELILNRDIHHSSTLSLQLQRAIGHGAGRYLALT